MCYKNSWKYYYNYNGKIIKINEFIFNVAFNDQQVHLENSTSGEPKENFLESHKALVIEMT